MNPREMVNKLTEMVREEVTDAVLNIHDIHLGQTIIKVLPHAEEGRVVVVGYEVVTQPTRPALRASLDAVISRIYGDLKNDWKRRGLGPQDAMMELEA